MIYISDKQGAGSRPISVMLPAPLSAPSSPEASDLPPRKRQRLTHLSPEEKALRRKLKNRVAAQTARDRKKARMGELELQVVELEIENQKLLLQNGLLREKTQRLSTENQELRQRLGLDALKEEEDEEESKVQIQSRVDDLGLVAGSAESAALRLCAPLQQVQAQKSSRLIISTWMLAALTIPTLSLISYLAFWTAWIDCIQICSSTTKTCSREVWRKKSAATSSIPYRPPRLLLWGPHQQSWTPLMN
ncbi:X-box-binding protein 1 isoform X1 [Ambystoma mexicanum]|uniref:X-box-binding protein 1 isoform X1 n=1 Tax=Ambystoma mexicanum TaxID=8296 RepID=UPI0037E71809